MRTGWLSGAVRLVRVGGVAIEVHLSFGLVLAWGAWQGWNAYGNGAGAAYGILAISTLFGWVLLHELGHALTARGFGIVVQRVTLLPIGGLARLETTPSTPGHELAIALAGPMVNLAVAVVLGAISWLSNPLTFTGWQASLLLLAPPGVEALLHYSLWVNVVLFFFNMLPAFPMDGGRVIRAAFAILVNYESGTRIAAWMGRLMAILIALLGGIGWIVPEFTPNPLLIVVGIVVYFGARQEELAVRRRRALLKLEAVDVCHQAEYIVSPSQPLTRKLRAQVLHHSGTLPVAVDGQLVGLVTAQGVHRANQRGRRLNVAHAMRTNYPAVRPNDTLWVALQEMRVNQIDLIPVVGGDRWYGVLTLDDIDRAWQFTKRRRK